MVELFEKKGTLDNSFVREYYNAQVNKMASYTHGRWNSTVVGRYDYHQTERAFKAAFGNERFSSGIEIGPGDAVWTKLILSFVDTLYLVEQSDEMLAQAKTNLAGDTRVTFERADFLGSNPPRDVGVVVASRCFEYFLDKPGALKKMYTLLKPKGKLILITKNKDLYTTKKVQHERIHSDQVSKSEMKHLLQDTGLRVRAVYPAVIRWKARYALMRAIFTAIHILSVKTGGRFSIPLLTRYSTESFVYVAEKE